MRLILTALILPLLASLLHAAEPRVLIDGYQLELVAEAPDIATPIGMAFDQKGRLLVIESHTHQRPVGYTGPAGDRIRMFADSDGDGRLDQWSTFAEGYQQAMNLCVRPDGGVYLVTRRDVRLLEDTDDDGAADKEATILRLETDADYPHNGMSGIAFEPARDGGGDGGELYLGIGENFGLAYTLVAPDGATFKMRDGAGNIFTCDADGTDLRRLATGFWNPFGLCFADHRQLFCVDNDPDASPPCRLIRVLPAGDYGFRFQYGRAGVHPLLAWNGELPGTLPMVCGTGEAPTAILYHRGHLWVTSWGDYRLERYETTVHHASELKLSVQRQTIVQGEADFRPTGAAAGPDGSIYFADWVSRSYQVHGQGRIWRLKLPSSAPPFVGSETADGKVPFTWSHPRDICQYFIYDGAELDIQFEDEPKDGEPSRALAKLISKRWREEPASTDELRRALNDADPQVRLFAVRWIADERLPNLRDDVARLLDGEIPNERYFLAVLAAIEWLDGDATPRSGGISDGLLRRELANADRSPQLHALALRLISPDHDWLTIERLRAFLASEAPELRREAVRTLAMQSGPERIALVAEIAADAAQDSELRADAVAGLAGVAAQQEPLLAQLADSDDPAVAREAGRVLRLTGRRAQPVSDPPHPRAADLPAWNTLLADGGDAESGRRLFFTAAGPQCANCHQHQGRGGRVGPDLTALGNQQSRERILASILQPSREITPHFQAWELLTTGGLTRVGLRLPKGGDDGVEPYADSAGREFELRSEEIKLRTPSDVSIMPEGLAPGLTVDDLRDLVAFLTLPPAPVPQ